jgi:ubiquinone/menaquinone biosynthesis C-methylase UbiE
MGGQRMDDAQRDFYDLPKPRGSYLDVGCGRGEMLRYAQSIGYSPCIGIEVVPALIGGDVLPGEAHAIPVADKSIDVVTMLDVIEHLLPGDDEAACRELARVAKRHVLLTANNNPSVQPDGTELHVNKRPYKEWDALLTAWFAPARVTWIRSMATLRLNRTLMSSQTWRVDF